MLAEYTKNSPYSQLILQGMVYKLFFYMYENHIPSENDEHTLYIKRFDKRIHDALIYIDSNLEHGSAIEEVASYVSLSPSHFSRLFTDVRLQHAQILLGTSQLSINEIAEKIGVANGNYLCTLFKKRYGISPSDYRKYLKQE